MALQPFLFLCTSTNRSVNVALTIVCCIGDALDLSSCECLEQSTEFSCSIWMPIIHRPTGHGGALADGSRGARRARGTSACSQCEAAQRVGGSTRETASHLSIWRAHRFQPQGPGVYDLIHRVKKLDAYVLITAERGSGKELVPRAIHSLSRRSKAPFVAVACGAIPETLSEAELFGYENTPYIGTNGAREGYLEEAGDGTIFFDQIAELSLNTQMKLLRVLQRREFTRLGGSRPITLRVRVLFATHRNLEEMVAQGTFRRDLYFVVNGFRIRVPGLWERTEDIPTLARAEYGKPVRHILASAMDCCNG
jgi:DNA-binding NtrC family response regulator